MEKLCTMYRVRWGSIQYGGGWGVPKSTKWENGYENGTKWEALSEGPKCPGINLGHPRQAGSDIEGTSETKFLLSERNK